jgi:5-methylcytosine-specific restriction endonuclease McrA
MAGVDADRCLLAVADAVVATVAGDRLQARSALAPIRGELWRGMPAWERPSVRLAGVRRADPAGRRCFAPARVAQTFVRDGCQCRYCGQRLIPVCLMSIVSLLYPEELPYVSTYKQGLIHRAYWELGAEADHLLPGSRGGSWTDPANHVTACVLCNTQKSDWTLEELGWDLRTTRDLAWDGLVSLYRPLWEAAERPGAGNQQGWLHAFSAATTG